MNKKILIFSLIIITLFVGCDKNYNLSVHIIDVGQGDCILIKTPSNKNMLIDGGDEDSSKIIKSYLKNKRVKNIDIVIATHPDSDHIGSLDYVIDNFNVESLYMPKQSTESESYNNLIDSCNKKNLKIQFLSKNNSLTLDENCKIQVLSPSYITDDNNVNSIVLNINYKNNNFLFTGDCEVENEIDMINSYELEDIDFLKVAHHGSNTSSSLDFLKEITPDVAVISCGYKNKYGHPHKSTLDNLKSVDAKIYRTDTNGSMVFYSDGDKLFTKIKYKAE